MRKILNRINPLLFLVVITLLVIFCSIIYLDFSPFSKTRVIVNLKILSKVLFGGLPLIILLIFFLGVITNKWGFKIEKMSLGGFNLLLDRPENLYKRSIRSFLDTKRTLFKIDLDRDNFDDTLSSYYKTYEFFRSEMKILNSEKKLNRWKISTEQDELYEVTNQILQVLNEFLTSHNNNYKRWYKYVSEKNEVNRIDVVGQVLEFHMTPISELQKQYYRYNEICDGFKEINLFFNTKVNDHFRVDIEKWHVG